LNIAFDARMINHSGIGIYIENLLGHLLPKAAEHSWTLYGPKKDLEEKLNLGGQIRVKNSTLPIYSIQEQLFHPVLSEKPDVFHVPHYNIPLLYRGNLITTIHDINHLIYPQFLTNRFAYPYAKYLIRQCLNKSKKIICVSQSTLDEVKNFFNHQQFRSQVIHEGLHKTFASKLEKKELIQIQNQYKLEKPFFLYVGNLKPHKNISTLMKLFNEVRTQLNSNYELVIVGKKFEKYPEIIKAVEEGKREGWVRHIENIPSRDLRGIYQCAEAFTILSLHEGFGLPLLEAFASDTPVLSSNISSLPEVAGNGALLVNPRNIPKVKELMKLLMTDSELKEELVENGRAELARFSWEHAANQTLAVYESCVKYSNQKPVTRVLSNQ